MTDDSCFEVCFDWSEMGHLNYCGLDIYTGRLKHELNQILLYQKKALNL